jgi:hypothetical protein
MRIVIDKAKTAAVITIALLMASVTLMAVPTQPIQPVQAQISGTIGTTPTNIYRYPNLGPLPSGVTPFSTFDTVAYMSITPNPIGVGQQVLVNMWCSPGMAHYTYMQGYKVTIQKPDGTTEVIGPFNSYLGDTTAWFQYVVDQVGTYKFKFEQPGTYVPAGVYAARPGELTTPDYTLGASLYYTASSTDWQELTVQQEWINSWPSAPLPTDYWTRPVTPEHREWWPILGNYPFSSAYYYPNGRVLYASNYRYTAYVQAPNTAHVVWRRQGNIGGLIGGYAYQYSSYSGGGTPSIIYAGRCYQTLTKQVPTYVNGSLILWPTTVWECYDLRTGQVYWDIQGVTAPTNILYEIGTIAATEQMEASRGYSVYLVAISGGRLYKYNPYTGAATLNISLPSYITSSTIYNNDLVYSVQTINATANNYRLLNWSMLGSSTDFTSRIGSNITYLLPQVISGFGVSGFLRYDFDAGVVTVGSWNLQLALYGGAISYCVGTNITSMDLNTGAVLFSFGTNDTLHDTNQSPVFITNRGKVAFAAQNRHWDCFDARTGKKLWESDLTAYPWGNWWAYSTASYDFNESKSAIIGSSYAGIYAIDWDTGHILWHYYAPEVPFESPYGGEPFFTAVTIADGKVYAFGGEHTTTQPITRGWHLHCINATTGELLWKIAGDMTPGAVADGYLTASCPYDGYMYVFGKGKSATTVSATPAVIAKGATTLIQGTVMDQSPGDQGSVQNPTAPLDSPTKPNTVPCVSAASMETQMEYLYMQHPVDGLYHNETITGVPVLLTAIGSKGNVISIGTTTTNGYYGTFGMAWTPPDEDTYTIMASFAGDDSYGSSSTGTSLVVTPAPASPTPTATPPEAAPDNTGLIYATLAAVIVAIIIGIVAVLVGLRKRQ